MMFKMTATADSRYSFVGQHLRASAIFVRRIRVIEQISEDRITGVDACEHLGLVCTVISQCAAALETEIHEVCVHGPGSYLGSNGTDKEAQRFLDPLVDIVDDQATLARFNLVLHVLRRPVLEKDRRTYERADIVVRLRNEVMHYKSRWGVELKSKKLFKQLESLHHRPPPFLKDANNFFPQRCLSADCAEWSLQSTVAFLEAFYKSLGVPSRFESYRSELNP